MMWLTARIAMTHLIDNLEVPLGAAGARSAPHLRSGEGLLTPSQRFDYLRQFGSHSQHFTGLQPGMSYFDMPGCGYLAFRKQWKQPVVLGDPVTAATDFEKILTAFLKSYPSASFVQVGAAVAAVLHDRWQFFGTQFGVEQRVPLADWSVSGKSRKCLRKAMNQARAKGIEVVEDSRSDLIDEVSDSWLQTRPGGGREIRFLVRPRDMRHVEGMRYFHARQDGRLVGFAYFDPGYSNGQIISYMPNISRGCSDFSQGLFYTIMAHAMDVFKREGVRWLELGLSPMVLGEEPQRFESRMLRSAFRLVYRYGRHYNFKGLYFTKTRFGGDWTPAYYCHRSALPVSDLARLTALTGLLRRRDYA